MWSFREIYLEEKVLYNSDELKIIDTLHSRERKRRDDNQGRNVNDRDILSTVQRATTELYKLYSDGELPDNHKVWIYDPKTRLNVVVEYDVVKDTNRAKIKVLTVMRTDSFRNSKDTTKKIIVK